MGGLHWLLCCVAASAIAVACEQAPAPTLGVESPPLAPAPAELWTCGMHPDVLEHASGSCPLCGMGLTPTEAPGGAAMPEGPVVEIDPVVVQNMGLRVAQVIRGRLQRTLQMVGSLREAETVEQDVVARAADGPHDGGIAAPPALLELHIFETQLPFVRLGMEVRAEFAALPGETVDGDVFFISPRMDRASHTVAVYATLDETSALLRPGMYATAEAYGRSDVQGPLVLREAVIDTGTRQIAFVLRGGGRFERREVVIGAVAGDWAEVASGLEVGEKVVVGGQFLLDGESRLREAIAKRASGEWDDPVVERERIEH